MAVSIRYPGSVAPVDISGLTDGLDALGKGLEERKTRKALDAYVSSLYDGGQEMSLAALAPRETTASVPTDMASQRVAQAHAASDPMSAYFTAIRSSESSGDDLAKNPNSSATGRYQFTEGTWNDLMRSQPSLGLTADGRTDPRQQEAAVRAFTAGNAKQLSRGGVQVNPGSLYAAHFLGADGAQNALTQPDQTPMASVVGPEVVQANPFLGNMTVGDFKAWAAQKAGGGAQTGSGASQGVQMAQSAVGGSPASLLPPREVMQELLRNPETRTLGITIAREAQKARTDPEAALRLEKLRAEIDKLRNPDASAKFGNSVIWGQDADGNWVAMQPSSGGGLIQAQTPDGIKLSPPGASNLNLGTQFAVRDRNGNVINTMPIDNTGKASDTAFGKDQGEARGTFASMSSKLPGLETVVAELDKLAEKATYTTGGQLLDLGRKELGMAPREAAIARTDYMAKVANQILPLLRDTFGAQFTAREGDTLMATLGDPDKTPAEKQAVLKSFIEQKKRDIEALATQTGQAAPTGKRLKFNPATGELE